MLFFSFHVLWFVCYSTVVQAERFVWTGWLLCCCVLPWFQLVFLLVPFNLKLRAFLGKKQTERAFESETRRNIGGKCSTKRCVDLDAGIDAVVRMILAVEINRSVLPWQETKSTPTGE